MIGEVFRSSLRNHHAIDGLLPLLDGWRFQCDGEGSSVGCGGTFKSGGRFRRWCTLERGTFGLWLLGFRLGSEVCARVGETN